MSSQSPSKTTHTKVLQVLRSKQHKNSVKDPRQLLYFKIKPEKSVSQLIIPYKDLRDNFPYALIEYYESKMKTKTDSQPVPQSLINENKKKNLKAQNIELEHSKTGKNNKKKHTEEKQPQETEKIILEENNDHQGQNMELIHDYDKYLQDNPHHFKAFYTILSQFQPIQNRYLKDLRNGENIYGRQGADDYNLQARKKKLRVDYSK